MWIFLVTVVRPSKHHGHITQAHVVNCKHILLSFTNGDSAVTRIPRRGTASEVEGKVSVITVSKNVCDSKIVTPETKA